MTLDDAIKKAFEEKVHVTRNSWNGRSISPSMLKEITGGQYEAVQLDINFKDDDKWEIDSSQKKGGVARLCF